MLDLNYTAKIPGTAEGINYNVYLKTAKILLDLAKKSN